MSGEGDPPPGGCPGHPDTGNDLTAQGCRGSEPSRTRGDGGLGHPRRPNDSPPAPQTISLPVSHSPSPRSPLLGPSRDPGVPGPRAVSSLAFTSHNRAPGGVMPGVVVSSRFSNLEYKAFSVRVSLVSLVSFWEKVRLALFYRVWSIRSARST